MINAVGREIPEEVLKATGKEPFKGVYAYDNYEYTKAAPTVRTLNDPTRSKLVENIHDALFKQIEADGVKNGLYLYPLRVALSGKAVTPGGGVELAKILGKQDTLARMRKAVEKLTAEIG